MKLSQLLDPRRMAAERDARAEGDGDAKGAWLAEAAKSWAREDAAALSAQIADMEELRGLAMGLARAAAVAEVAGLEAVADGKGEDGDDGGEGAAAEGHLPPSSRRCARAVQSAGSPCEPDAVAKGDHRSAPPPKRRRREGFAAVGHAVRTLRADGAADGHAGDAASGGAAGVGGGG